METNFNNSSRLPNTYFRNFLFQFLSIFFRYLYNEMAWTYDWVASMVSLGKWNEWIETTLTYLNGSKILELGHGPGRLIVILLESGKKAFGIDLSSYMGKIASVRLINAQLPLNLSTAQAQHLPFQDESFDQVVATFPTEYILDQESLKEIYRILKQGGSVVILPVAWITGTGLPDRIASWLFRITGQSPRWDNRALAPAIGVGFDVSTQRISLKTSEVLIVIASKPKQPKLL